MTSKAELQQIAEAEIRVHRKCLNQIEALEDLRDELDRRIRVLRSRADKLLAHHTTDATKPDKEST